MERERSVILLRSITYRVDAPGAISAEGVRLTSDIIVNVSPYTMALSRGGIPCSVGVAVVGALNLAGGRGDARSS